MVKKLNKKIIQFITVLISVLFLSNIFNNNVSALSWSYGTTTVSGYYSGSSESSFNLQYDNSRMSYLTLPDGVRLTSLNFDFATGTNFNSAIKPNLSGNQYFNITFYMGCSGAVLNSIGTVSYRLPVITDVRTSTTGEFSKQIIYGYNPNDGNFYYPSNSTQTSEYNEYYISVSGYIPTSQNWDGILSFGGAILLSPVNSLCSIGAPTLNLYDNDSQQTTNAIDRQTQQDQQHYEEQQNQAEEQGQDAQDNSDETQSQVDNKTQNLFSFITSFFGAFTSASPSNCNFDWGLADKGFGVINMCQTNIPVELQSILSIVSILIVVPMVLWLINSIVGAFKEFQQ